MKHRTLAIVALLSSVAFAAAGCSRSTAIATAIEETPHARTAADPADPKLSEALKAIDKNPDAAKPYIALASI